MKKNIFALSLLTMFLLSAQAVFAHAIVSPNQADVAQFINFTLVVPSEKPISTVAVRLLLPPGLNFVTPYVKAGWKTTVVQSPEVVDGKPVMTDDGTQAQTVSELDYSGGNIPSGQQDQFTFNAQVPDQATTLDWKVYQTYSDGSVVSWDQDPNATQPKDSSGNLDFSKVGPYSQTQIINDLATAMTPSKAAATGSNTVSNLALVLSIVALVVSLGAVFRKPSNI